MVLAAIGAFSLALLVMNLFSAFGDRADEWEITSDCELGSQAFLDALGGLVNSPARSGGTAKLLNNGAEFIPAILEAIAGARSTVNFMVYIWDDGKMSDLVIEALVAAARRGVQVRLLIDGFGGLKAPREGIEKLQAAGARWEWFNPPRFGKLTRFHKRHHRRAIVVDGRIGFTGGAAVMDKWLGDARNPDEWRDCMVEVRGCIAGSLQAAFSQLWATVTGEMLVGDGFYPSFDEEADAGSGEPISQHINVVSSPSHGAHPMRSFHWLSCRAARERIYITNPYFVPDDIMSAVLRERARNGVDVRVLVPNEHNDLQVIRWASRHYYEELLESGMRIYEFQPTMIHQKMIVIDGKWSIVGTANLDVRSKELNQENVLGILDTEFAKEMETTFLEDLARAREIDLEEFRRRPAHHRVVERVCSLFEEQF